MELIAFMNVRKHDYALTQINHYACVLASAIHCLHLRTQTRNSIDGISSKSIILKIGYVKKKHQTLPDQCKKTMYYTAYFINQYHPKKFK